MNWFKRRKWSSRGFVAVAAAPSLVGVMRTSQELVTALGANETVLLQMRLTVLPTAVFWSCCTVGCFFGCLGLLQWSESRRVFESISASDRHVMTALCRVSEANRIVYSSKAIMLFVATIGLMASLLLNEPRWIGFVIMVVGIRWWLWVRISTPPFILFLSSSDTQSVEMHWHTKRLVSPLRVVTLLDLVNSPTSGVSDELLLDCLRTGNDDDWWKVITILIELAPLVVINADTESPGVVKEALHLISEDITYKTVFLTHGDACLLRREPEPAASASDCLVASGNTLRNIIAATLNSGKLPDRIHTVRFLALRVHSGRKFE